MFGHLWYAAKDGDRRALALYRRHYSARRYRDGRKPALFCGPGEKLVLLTVNADALLVWLNFIDPSGQHGISCSVFRNESDFRSSDLIREAVALAWQRWPGQRLYTYVNAARVQSNNPGFCFKVAGWRRCGTTKGGLLVLERLPDAP